MDSFIATLLTYLNKLGRNLPYGLRRRITDFPGVLTMFSALTRSRMEFAPTPEGYTLAFNPLLHSNMLTSGSFAAYEPQLQAAIRRYTGTGMIAYDIGANVGLFSLLFYSIVRQGDGMVYAFEPEPNNIACLERTLAANECPGIKLCRQAVSNTTGAAPFDRRGGAFSGRLVGAIHNYTPTRNIATVETTSVDACVFERGFHPPGIVKIDVEGNEGLVLEGMQGVMEKFHPIVICEIHTHLGDNGQRILDLLSQHDYDVSKLDSGHTLAVAKTS